MRPKNDSHGSASPVPDADSPTHSWQQALDISVYALVATNLIPLGGVLFLGWDTAVILVVYWAENLVVGFYNILKMVLARVKRPVDHAAKLLMIPFFLFHFGGFCAAHGLFIFIFTNELSGGRVGGVELFPDAASWWGPLMFVGLLVHVIHTVWAAYSHSIMWPVISLFVSHGVSFLQNHILRGEYRKRGLEKQMIAPYGRIMLMHVAIIAAGFPVMLLGSPVPLLLILVTLKIIIDVWLHLVSHNLDRPGTLAALKQLLPTGSRQ